MEKVETEIETRDIPNPSAAQKRVPDGTALLDLEGVRVAFGDIVAVKNVSLTLHGGSLLGLIGPNGAGKTTLLRAIASLQSITSGEVRVMGRKVIPGDEDAARLVGFTPDVPPLYDALTVQQFLRFIAAGYGIPAETTDTLIDFWLEKVWLTDKAKQKISGLSRGMKQRLGLARTLLPNPQIILLDEPAAGLDPAGRVQFRKLLNDLREQGRTLIVSSHILSDMEEYCTHVAIMSHGTLMQFGTVQEIATGIDTGRCRYTVLLAEPVPSLEQAVGEIEGVTHVVAERLLVTLEYWNDRPRAAELLRTLVNEGLPIAGFSANAAGLEEAYLRAGIEQVD